jgi:RNA polymerase sigma factor for flagellar operon FliA
MLHTNPTMLDSHHLAMARRIARSVARQQGGWAPLEELEGAAMVGLAEAAKRFDASRCPSFEGYARQRIRGAVIDELRRLDGRSRRVRRRHCQSRAARDRLRNRLGCEPTTAAIAAECGDTEERVAESLDAIAPAFVAFDDVQVAGEAGSIEAALDNERARARVRAHLAELDDRSRRVVELYFFEGLGLRDIGRRLGVTESRVCQLKSRALRTLAEAMAPAPRCRAARRAA